MTNNIKKLYETKNKFKGFLVAGDPSMEKTAEYIEAIVAGGASLVEIGVPFSDPIAEGEIIFAANVRALAKEGGCTTDMVFDMIEGVKEKVNVPFVLRLYMNQIFKYGYDRFFAKCNELGIKGLVIPDLPAVEMDEITEYMEKYDVDVITVVTTEEEEYKRDMMVETIRDHADTACERLRKYVKSMVVAHA